MHGPFDTLCVARAVMQPGEAHLRLHEFNFALEPDATPVVVVRFVRPGFDIQALEALIGVEVAMSLFEDRAEITHLYEGTVTVLRADSVSAEAAADDTQDYLERIRELDEAVARLHADLRNASHKEHGALSLAIELLRRAEIKAAASEDLMSRQAAAIAVLERLIRHYRPEV